MIDLTLRFGQQWSTVGDSSENDNAITHYENCVQKLEFDAEHIIITSFCGKKELCCITLANEPDVIRQLKLLVIALETDTNLMLLEVGL